MTHASPQEPPVHRSDEASRGARGQILVIAALGIIAMLAMVALLIEGGNAYAQQRAAQNGSDAAANAGAVVLAQKLAGITKADTDVAAALNAMAASNQLAAVDGRYTDVAGKLLTSGGAVTTVRTAAARVGDGLIPNGAQGVSAAGDRTFNASIGKVIGFETFTASADATAVTGRLIGGAFIPVVFPINIVDCAVNGDLGTGEANWTLSQPGTPPDGQEFIVPLCKTGAGNFQILDFDGSLTCAEEISTPVFREFPLPVDIPSDNGNDCAKKIEDGINALQGKTVLVPICDVDCTTVGGSKATYHIVKVAAFYVDYFSDSNNPHKNSELCEQRVNPTTGQTIIPIRGNGSSSCMAGWFVRYISAGPVGSGSIGTSDAIGIQLIK
jgi:Flp pilus assembly protein TadG